MKYKIRIFVNDDEKTVFISTNTNTLAHDSAYESMKAFERICIDHDVNTYETIKLFVEAETQFNAYAEVRTRMRDLGYKLLEPNFVQE